MNYLNRMMVLAIGGSAAISTPHTVFAAGQGSRLLEEVMVTAQKREEDSQDIPIMISAFSGEKLDAMGVDSTSDLQKITPGLTFTYTYGYTVIYLRGIGTDAFLPNSEIPV